MEKEKKSAMLKECFPHVLNIINIYIWREIGARNKTPKQKISFNFLQYHHTVKSLCCVMLHIVKHNFKPWLNQLVSSLIHLAYKSGVP